ncbi:MAG: hypothetical protein K0R84_1678 [Clostridia bacterium]|jgi:hypothetical protein|nr:hypothetical protein [Clostridia bacterium]
MIRSKKSLAVYFRLAVNTAFVFIATYGSVIVVMSICNTLFNTSFTIDYSDLRLTYIIPLSLITSLLTLTHNLYTTMVVRIDDRTEASYMIEDAAEGMKWRMEDRGEDFITLVSPLREGIFKEEITIKFTDTEAFISGPHKSVERLISFAKFPYKASEISNPSSYVS